VPLRYCARGIAIIEQFIFFLFKKSYDRYDRLDHTSKFKGSAVGNSVIAVKAG